MNLFGIKLGIFSQVDEILGLLRGFLGLFMGLFGIKMTCNEGFGIKVISKRAIKKQLNLKVSLFNLGIIHNLFLIGYCCCRNPKGVASSEKDLY